MRFDTKLEYETYKGVPCKYLGVHPERVRFEHMFAQEGSSSIFFVNANGYEDTGSLTCPALIREKKKRHVRWVNLYDPKQWGHETKELADRLVV